MADVLAYLAAHQKRVVSKEELLEHVWREIYVGDAAVFRAIAGLRKALDDGQTRYIQTQRGRGYRLTVSVRWPDLAASKPTPALFDAATEPSTMTGPMRAASRRFKRRTVLGAAAALAVALIGAWLAWPATPPAPPVDSEIVRLIERGRESYRQYDRDGAVAAISHFERAATLDPNSAVAHAGLATALTQRYQLFDRTPGLLEAAAAAARRAIAHDPALGEGYRALGLAQQGKGHLSDAALAFEHALEIEPGLSEARANLATVYLATGRIDEALALQAELYGTHPLRWIELVNLSASLILLGDLQTPRGLLEEALELSPYQPLAISNLVLIDAYQGDLERAAARVRDALAARPDSPLLWNTAGDLARLTGDYDEATARYGRSLELSSSAPPAVYIGLTHAARNQSVPATTPGGVTLLADLESDAIAELAAGSEAWMPRFQLAQIHALRGSPETALAWFEASIRQGYVNYRWARMDPVLDSLRALPEFRTLVDGVEARMSTMRQRAAISQSVPAV